MKRRHQPQPLTTDPADQYQLAVMGLALLDSLSSDLRVREVNTTILEMPETPRRIMNIRLALMAKDQVTAGREWRILQPIILALLSSQLRPLQIPGWLLDRLALFVLRFTWSLIFNEQLPPQVWFQLDTPLASRGKRLPKSGMATIERDARWFYRARWKSPTDSFGQLAREYVAQKRAEGVNIRAAKGTVRDGVERIAVWLTTSPAPRT